jgi:hypothetical protein
MNPIAEKYMFVFLSRSITIFLVTSPDFGAFGSEPSVGTSLGEEMAGEY